MYSSGSFDKYVRQVPNMFVAPIPKLMSPRNVINYP